MILQNYQKSYIKRKNIKKYFLKLGSIVHLLNQSDSQECFVVEPYQSDVVTRRNQFFKDNISNENYNQRPFVWLSQIEFNQGRGQ